jgi:hypothetical protein
MKKLGLFLFALLAFVVMSCEGPMGPDGTAGIDGVNGVDGIDGNVTCLACHSDDNMNAITHQFSGSQHTVGEFVDYAGGRASCSRCHSHEGFVAFATGLEAQDIASPGAWECATCHGLHSTFEADDYALRMSSAVSFIFDETVTADFGSGNLCVNCHQSRRAEPNVTNPGDMFTITSSHYGPHHGPQGNIVNGVGMAEVVGDIAYPEAGSAAHMGVSCNGCHMGEYDVEEGLGGHTYSPSVLACNSCHGELEDFDYNGTQAEVEELLVELRDVLLVQGVLAQDDEGGYHPVSVMKDENGDVIPGSGEHSMVQAQGFFNWIGLEEDRSLGVHNPKYVKALLKNTIKALG